MEVLPGGQMVSARAGVGAARPPKTGKGRRIPEKPEEKEGQRMGDRQKLAYTPEELRLLWKREMAIYQEIAGICERHGLRYFAACGTVLGAVRHGGFIPWDDDMDVAMPRKDYEAFLKVAPLELREDLEILGIGLTAGYVIPFAKVSDRNSTFIEETDQQLKYHSGIFVDIFPMDEAAPTHRQEKRHRRGCWFWGRAGVLAEYGQVKMPEGLKGFKRGAAEAACRGVHALMKLFGISTLWCYRHFLKEARRYEKEEPERIAGYADVSVESTIHQAKNLFPTAPARFEDITVRIPRDPDIYLKNLYGDYMVLPPPDRRINHFPAVLDFDH